MHPKKKMYPSQFVKMKELLKRNLSKYKSYRDLERKKVEKLNHTVEWDTEVRYIDPNEVKVMQLPCEKTNDDFRFYYSRVPIHKVEKGRFNPYTHHGVVLDGDWDKYTKSHDYDRVYTGLKEHYENNKEWRKTEYIKQYEIREKVYQKEGYTEEKIEEIEKLYKSLKQKGFVKNYELEENEERPVPDKRKCSVSINIDRNGNYIFNNVAHNRLGLSKILELDKIPVLVVVRHKESKNKII